MAAFWGSLSNGYYQGLDQARQRQIAQMQLQQLQDQQAGQGALANQYAQYLPPPPTQQPPQQPPQGGPPGGGQPPQGAMPPPPGQQSQPQRPPQGPPPGGGMPPPPQQGQGGPPPQRPPQMPPYTAPQAPQPPQQPMGGQPQQQGQQGIPPPPGNDPVSKAVQSTLPDVHEMAAKLQAQGITGMPLFYALQQHQQFLSQDGKQQLAQLTLELKGQMAQMQNQIKQQQVGVNQEKADTSRLGETRRGETAAGTNAAGKATIDVKESQAGLNKAKTEKAIRAVNSATASGGKPDDKLIDYLAEQAAAGDKSVFTNLGRGKQGSETIMAIRRRMAEKAEEAGTTGTDQAATNAEFGGVQAGQRALGTRTANVGMAVNEASKFADIALKASQAVERSKFPDFNKLMLAGEQKTGGEDVVRFSTATNSLINAYARAVSPTGAPTVSDKEHARELISTAYSKGQFAAAISQMKQEMEAAKSSPGAVRDELRSAVTGKGGAPKVGTVKGGYRFKGGDPAQQSSWEKV